MTSTKAILDAQAHPQANVVFALECLMFESWDGMPEGADKTTVRLRYIETLLRHFDVTPKAGCGYSPERAPFIGYKPASWGLPVKG